MWPRSGPAVGFAVFLTGVVVLAAVAVWQAWYPGRAFDPDLWRDKSRMAEGVRSDMAARSLARGTLDGKTKAKVIELLGEPSFILQAGNEDPTGPDLVYQLGPYSLLGPDSEWLTSRIGPDGQVACCFTWHD
jgi:hypothetical protein